MTKGGRISRMKVDSYILYIFYLGSKKKFDAVGSEPQLLTSGDVGPGRWIAQPRVPGPHR